MSKFEKHIDGLAKLQAFEPSIFVGDAAYPEELCDFMLALALVYNDFRDIFVAQILLQEVLPSDLKTPTPQLGEFGGINIHLMRTLAGILRELIVLLEDCPSIPKTPQFQNLVAKLQPEARSAWQSVLAVAGHKPKHNPLTKLLIFARNNVSFHYSTKALAAGYRSSFVDGENREPYLSAGSTMANTRFYFADAAAEKFLRETSDPETVEQFFLASSPILKHVNRALHDLVLHFTKVRGGVHSPRKASA